MSLTLHEEDETVSPYFISAIDFIR
jgi:dual specificity MAP kinase phosphatase